MAYDLKALTPDTSFPANGFLMGGDSQSASDPSFYSHTAYYNYILGLASTWSVNSAVSAPAASYTGTWFTGGTATTTKPHFLIEPAGTTSTGWSTAGTGFGINAAALFAGNLIDTQVDGSRKFAVNADGGLTIQGGATLAADGASLYFNRSVISAGTGNNSFSGSVLVDTPRFVGWSDVLLARDAANVLALRNSTSAQTFNTYGTYTDGSNYRRVKLTMTTAGVASLTAEGAGTGASGNVLHISSLPTSNPGPGILWNNAGTPAIGT